MAPIREYLLSVTAAAMISAIVLHLLEGKGSVAATVRMTASVFVILTVIRPVSGFRLSQLQELIPDVSVDVQAAVSEGEQTAKAALISHISESVEAYILDKATELGVSLTVRVELSEDVIPIPVQVYLKGNISPYNKTKLQNILESNLGLEKENQIWY